MKTDDGDGVLFLSQICDIYFVRKDDDDNDGNVDDDTDDDANDDDEDNASTIAKRTHVYIWGSSTALAPTRLRIPDDDAAPDAAAAAGAGAPYCSTQVRQVLSDTSMTLRLFPRAVRSALYPRPA